MSSRTLLALTIVLAVVLTGSGCSSSTAPSAPTSLLGNWDFTESVTNAQIGSSCQISSSVLALSQNGDSLSATFTGGTQVCTLRSFPPGSLSLAGSTFSTGWQMSGSSVIFQPEYAQYGECPFRGTVSGSPPNQMDGTVHCTVYAGGMAQTISGHWNAALIIGRAKPAK